MKNAEIIEELGKLVVLYARGDTNAGDMGLLTLARAVHADRKSERESGETKRGDSSKAVGAMRTEIAQRLFAYWQEQCQHPRAKLTPERARCIVARLKEGYSEQDIRSAIDGAAANAFVNDDGHKYDDITLICRNGSKLESFIARSGAVTGSDVDARVEEPALETTIRDLRRAMAKARAEDDDARFAELKTRLDEAIKRRPQ
jgi:hypothetical protein